MRRVIACVALLAGCWKDYGPYVQPKPEPVPITVAVIEFGDGQDAENGCVMAVLEAGHRVVDRKLIDAALPNDADIDYQQLGHALSADLIIDGGILRGVKMRQLLSPRIISARSGDVLAAAKSRKRADRGFQIGHDTCAELLKQLP